MIKQWIGLAGGLASARCSGWPLEITQIIAAFQLPDGS